MTGEDFKGSQYITNNNCPLLLYWSFNLVVSLSYLWNSMWSLAVGDKIYIKYFFIWFYTYKPYLIPDQLWRYEVQPEPRFPDASCSPTKIKQLVSHKDVTQFLWFIISTLIIFRTTPPRCVYCSLPWAIAASLLFSSGLSCNIVWMTGKSACLSLPDCRKMNCSRTFFRYSRLATLFSRSWFRSRRRSSLFSS